MSALALFVSRVLRGLVVVIAALMAPADWLGDVLLHASDRLLAWALWRRVTR